MKKYILIIASAVFFACNTNENQEQKKQEIKNKVEQEIGNEDVTDSLGSKIKLKDLSEFSQTSFIPCLESSFSAKNNCIYAASLLFAWDEIKTEINQELSSFSSPDLLLMNNSKTYQGVLSKDEYTANVNIEGKRIFVKTFFQKSLVYEDELTKYSDKETSIKFSNKFIETFGFNKNYYNNIAHIAYYNNDDDFAVILTPEDKDNEIILIKTAFKDSINIINQFENYKKEIADFQANKTEKNSWKYYFGDDDELKIPIIEFNIETNFNRIEGSVFSSLDTDYKIIRAYQRNAFMFNEKGAKVESEAEMATEEACEPEEEGEEIIPPVKLMHYDKPYIILLKKKNAGYPYFVVYISNIELMKMIE